MDGAWDLRRETVPLQGRDQADDGTRVARRHENEVHTLGHGMPGEEERSAGELLDAAGIAQRVQGAAVDAVVQGISGSQDAAGLTEGPLGALQRLGAHGHRYKTVYS